MAFNYFLIAVSGIYLLYYMSMVGMDIMRMKKEKNGDEQGKEINISDAVASYKPQVASEVMAKESEEFLKENSNGGSQPEAVPAEPLPFQPDPSFMSATENSFSEGPDSFFVSSDDFISNDEDEQGSGGLDIKYDPSEEVKDKYPEVNINGGYSALHLQDMLNEISAEESLFSHVNFAGI